VEIRKGNEGEAISSQGGFTSLYKSGSMKSFLDMKSTDNLRRFNESRVAMAARQAGRFAGPSPRFIGGERALGLQKTG